jgi:hypothetical protein
MTVTTGFPQLSSTPIDPKTGQWRREWLLLLQTLWNRTGGTAGTSADDIAAAVPEDQPAEQYGFEVSRIDRESASVPYVYMPPVEYSPTELADIMARLAALEYATLPDPVDITARVVALESAINDIATGPNT